jgi:ABC-2 type transport system ATP-binding protein
LPLHVSNLTKRYGRLTALSEVSFSIRPGEVLGLIGPNGSGKTTLFECLGGVLPADSGSVSEDGRALTAADRRVRVFYLPDAIAPWPAQTVHWALEFITGYFGSTVGRPVQGRRDGRDQPPPRLRRSAVAVAKAEGPALQTDDVVHQLGLESLLDSPIGTLSKGQRKRALLAIGLLTPQPILLADEPFDGLDLRQTREVAQTLRAHAARGRTMFLSIHQIADAARVCDRFVLLSGGRVCGEGTLDELSAVAHQPGERNLEDVFLALT